MAKLESIEVAKFPCVVEEITNIIMQLIGIYIVYLLFKEIGKEVTDNDFNIEILLSMVVLPAILVLKQASEILQPYFVKVVLKDDVLFVKQGILTTFEDNLTLDSVENVEKVTTLLGKYFNYSTIRIYAYGSWVVVPNVKNSEVLTAKLDEIIKTKKGDIGT